jgi:hypothetical protein
VKESLKYLSNWSGNAQQLANELELVTKKLGIPDTDVNPNERLVRHYVSLGILDRPTREGKEAIYRYHHIIQYLAARSLARDGWPLAKVAEQVAMSSDDILHSLIEATHPSVLEETLPSSAAELVAKYKAQGIKADPKRTLESTKQIARSPNLLSEEQVRQPSYLTKQKIEDQATLMALGNATGSPKQKDLLEIELTEWCRLLIDRLQLSKMPPETPELLGRAVERYLTRELARQRGKYK